MEHASIASRVSPFEKLRAGQREVVDHFAGNRDTVARLPTGYGKTLTGTACYVKARQAGWANRLLWIVPRGAQADQAAESIPGDMINFFDVRPVSCGSGCSSWNVGEALIPAIRAHRMGESEIFVVTVQTIMSQVSNIQELMSTGRWMICVDEHHHYGEIDKSKWSRVISGLPSTCRLAMSATPDRSDGRSLFRSPDVSVSYSEAADEGAVKRLHLDLYDYTGDFAINGDIVQLTMDELIEIIGPKSMDPRRFDAKLAERNMRKLAKYVSPLIERPVFRLIDLRVDRNIRGQMIVQAMSCNHAKEICSQIKGLLPDHMKVDWVGTGPNGRDDSENKRILNAFCPPKDSNGKRNWTLDILVNVGIAGEGLYTVDVCEVVFCTRPGINPSTFQTIGRGARLMKVDGEQPICHINFDKMSELREYVGFDIMNAIDGLEPGTPSDEGKPRGELEYKPMPDEPYMGVVDMKLTEVHMDPFYNFAIDYYAKTRPEFAEKLKSSESGVTLNDFKEMFLMWRNQEIEPHNAAAVASDLREQVQTATSKLTGLVIRKFYGSGRREKTLVGDIMRKIATRRKRHVGCSVDEASPERLKQHYQWVKACETELLAATEIPAWLA